MRSLGTEERRSRLAIRHRLTAPTRADDVVTVAADLVGLHSTDPSTVYLSAWARMRHPTVDAIEQALYEDRTVVRVLGMRRTMFVVPTVLLPLLHHGCAAPLGPRERRRMANYLENEGITTDGESWLDRVQADTLAALCARHQAVANELREDVPDLTTKITFGAGKKWGGTVGVSTRVLFLLATDGLIVRARPRGTWISSQYRWAPIDEWIEGGIPDMDPEDARNELVRRWLRSFGPGTETDLTWWTGWTLGQTRAALRANDAVQVALDDGTGYVLPDDLEPAAMPEPWIALLPSLDPTTMGWKARGWYFGEHAPLLFDRSGNAGPTVWSNGRVVGGWGQHPDGEIVYRLLEDVGADAARAIQDRAGALEEWLGDIRITPRFRTPLERELRG